MAEEVKEGEHEELAVLEQAGPVQIPREYLQATGADGKIRIVWEEGRIILRSPHQTYSIHSV